MRYVFLVLYSITLSFAASAVAHEADALQQMQDSMMESMGVDSGAYDRGLEEGVRRAEPEGWVKGYSDGVGITPGPVETSNDDIYDNGLIDRIDGDYEDSDFRESGHSNRCTSEELLILLDDGPSGDYSACTYD